MVKGIDIFRERLGPHANHYVMIGGTACSILLEREGLEFRSTRDLDMVVVVDQVSAEFGGALWQMIQDGKYRNSFQSDEGEKIQFYRFDKPETDGFPAMLELFSRSPDGLLLPEDAAITPLPMGEDVSSLSAILLNDDSYDFVINGSDEIEEVRVLRASHLIPVKAQAWTNLKAEKEAGKKVDSKNIKKHPKDIARLMPILNPDESIDLPESLIEDMVTFTNTTHNIADEILKEAGIKEPEMHEILKTIYGLG